MMTLALLLCALPGQDDAPELDRVRSAVERSLPYLEKEGVAWIQKRDCLSCHQVTFMLWAHLEAMGKGIAMDRRKLAEWAQWSQVESTAQRVRFKLTDSILETLKVDGMSPDIAAKLAPFAAKPELKGGLKESALVKELAKSLSAEELSKHRANILQHAAREKGDGGGLDTMTQLLLTGAYGDADRQFVASTRDRIVELQQTDGSWKPGGQLGRMNRSEAEAAATTTMWTVIALDAAGATDAVSRGRAFLKDEPPGRTIEWLAARTLFEERLGEPESLAGFLEQLRGRQNPDGGWSWVQGLESDALATGQALYALGASGASDSVGLRRARKFLVETQAPDGSWFVSPAAETAPGSKPERNKRLEPIYRYWGSAWATIGLARTLP
jgi:squalene-hopene/tetraprenyl-beta-curcumene cyclase